MSDIVARSRVICDRNCNADDDCYFCESRAEIEQLRAALALCDGWCPHLHHEKKHQHAAGEPCPVEAIIMKAKGLDGGR